MATTLDQFIASPDQYFYAFDGDQAVFVPMDRAAYRRSIFLDQRISLAAEGTTKVPIAALVAQGLSAAPTGWIFHLAHCGSTLLARALEALDQNLVLREPAALRQLGLAADPARLRPALALLSRRYSAQAPTLIKANVPVNFILDDIALTDPAARAVLLYCTLPDYLLAILRSAQHRAWLRGVTGQLTGHLGDLSHLADGELGAALWLVQMQRFAAAIARMPQARSLDAEHFFAAPAETLAAAAQLLEIPADKAAISEIVSGALFSTYSKNPALAFDNAARLARRRVLQVELGPELARAQLWIARTAPDISVTMAAITAAKLTVSVP